MEVQQYEIAKDVLTFFVEVNEIPQGINAAFENFGKLLNGFDGREVYGVSGNDDGKLIYRACVTEKFPGEASRFNLPYYNVPKGKYICTVLKDWRAHLPEINQVFHQLMQHPEAAKNSICVEYYKNEEEALLMVTRVS